MIYTLSDIQSLIIEYTGAEAEEVQPDTDINLDLGCCGDDFDDLMQAYSKKYKVDMSSYLWYFHTEEEGHNNSIGRIFFKTPYERVKQIPVTPALLLDFANAGKWNMAYPEHTLSKQRYDSWVNVVVVLLVAGMLLYRCSQ